MPLSIVVGCGLIGAGLYFGLRERPAAPAPVPPEPAPTAPETAASATALPGAPPLAPSGQPEAALRERVAADAGAALAAAKTRLRETCWAPAIAEQPLPAQARYVFDVTFDAAGIEIGRGISEIRSASRADVAQCLRKLPMDLRVPPPGVNVGVEVDLAFP